ncbi:PRTRC system ThiF family protein [Salinisphaera sp. T31B1]|uniref:PRTRC system ThiF family protein n=1 Tax=Salinisphaera sp. T31B1 TaxID=727963 RepID=UPI003340133F
MTDQNSTNRLVSTPTRQTFYAPEWLMNPHQAVEITVLGAGGTGGEVLDQLCRLHATLNALGHRGLHVTLYDGDTISASNVGRQRYSAMEIGENKAAAIISRINMFYGTAWEGVPLHWAPEAGLDRWVISATDSAAVRHQIAAYGAQQSHRITFSNNRSLWLDFGNGEHTGQAILGHLHAPQDFARDALRLPHVIDLFPEMQDDPNDGPSCSVEAAIRSQAFGINAALVTNAFATLVWPLFRTGAIDRHGLFIDVREGSVSPLRIDPLEWSLMGYDAAIEGTAA